MDSNVCKVLGGEIAIGHRPKLKHIPVLQKTGFTHVVTILSEKEGANKILESVRSSGLIPIWIPLGGAKPIMDELTLGKVISAFNEIQSALKNNAKIYLHCSAGIHRTGMITNALLLYLGYSEDEALKILGDLREITLRDVGAERLEWGSRFKGK